MDTSPVRLIHMQKTNKTKAITTAEACTTVWLYKTYRKLNGVFFFFLGSKRTWIMFKFQTVTRVTKKRKRIWPWPSARPPNWGPNHSENVPQFLGRFQESGKWVLPSIQLGSFKGIIIHRVRHEVSSSMFLSVDILAKSIVLLLRSASLRISWKVN